jgi:hypothetical protein
MNKNEENRRMKINILNGIKKENRKMKMDDEVKIIMREYEE